MMERALQHHRNGMFSEAGQIYRRVLAIDPRNSDALHLLGMIAYQAGDLETAADLIRQAIAIHGNGAAYYTNLATILQAQGKLEEAESMYRHALTLKPHLASIHVNLGNVLQARSDFDASVQCYEQALALEPDNAEAFNNLGNARQGEGNLDAAVSCYERALAIRPNYPEALCNLGNASWVEGRLDEAIELYQRALTLKPDYAEGSYGLGNVRRAQGDSTEALRQYRNALRIRPEYAQAGFAEALAQLLQGDFAAGWQNFERRWQTTDHDTPRRFYAQPAWDGEKLTSGSVLVWGEQGVGDEVMFAGLIPEVIRTGNRCVLGCDRRLNGLFARSFPGVAVISGCGPGSHPELEIAAQLPSGSLPGLFRRSAADFAQTTSPFLIADSAARERFRSRYSDGRRLVGLAWYSNNRRTGRARSIDLASLAPLFASVAIQWISLQYGDHDALQTQAAATAAPIFIDRAVNQLSDIDVFAAQIAAMDLVITIDNSTAHLAGALGVPVWVLLPFAPDWRWQLHREDSPWYPTMRLFRQPAIGNWQSVIETVGIALSQKMAEAAADSRQTRMSS
jgi:tetratricopeptide (TPR) repeat protein